jgi:hypothetical protein
MLVDFCFFFFQFWSCLFLKNRLGGGEVQIPGLLAGNLMGAVIPHSLTTAQHSLLHKLSSWFSVFKQTDYQITFQHNSDRYFYVWSFGENSMGKRKVENLEDQNVVNQIRQREVHNLYWCHGMKSHASSCCTSPFPLPLDIVHTWVLVVRAVSLGWLT